MPKYIVVGDIDYSKYVSYSDRINTTVEAADKNEAIRKALKEFEDEFDFLDELTVNDYKLEALTPLESKKAKALAKGVQLPVNFFDLPLSEQRALREKVVVNMYGDELLEEVE